MGYGRNACLKRHLMCFSRSLRRITTVWSVWMTSRNTSWVILISLRCLLESRIECVSTALASKTRSMIARPCIKWIPIGRISSSLNNDHLLSCDMCRFFMDEQLFLGKSNQLIGPLCLQSARNERSLVSWFAQFRDVCFLINERRVLAHTRPEQTFECDKSEREREVKRLQHTDERKNFIQTKEKENRTDNSLFVPMRSEREKW